MVIGCNPVDLHIVPIEDPNDTKIMPRNNRTGINTNAAPDAQFIAAVIIGITNNPDIECVLLASIGWSKPYIEFN